MYLEFSIPNHEIFTDFEKKVITVIISNILYPSADKKTDGKIIVIQRNKDAYYLGNDEAKCIVFYNLYGYDVIQITQHFCCPVTIEERKLIFLSLNELFGEVKIERDDT